MLQPRKVIEQLVNRNRVQTKPIPITIETVEPIKSPKEDSIVQEIVITENELNEDLIISNEIEQIKQIEIIDDSPPDDKLQNKYKKNKKKY